MTDLRTARTSSPVLSIGFGALLALGAGSIFAPPAPSSETLDIGRYELRTLSQSAGGTAAVVLDTATGEAWVQRVAAGAENMPWVPMGTVGK